MKTKSMIFGIAVISSLTLMAADTPEVENVVMTQAQFGRMVTVTFKLKNASAGAVVTFDVSIPLILFSFPHCENVAENTEHDEELM